MAILWEQREIVRVLKSFEDEELSRLPYEHQRKTIEQQVHETYANPQGYAIWETVLLKKMLKLKFADENDIPTIRSLQRLLNSCIKDGFIIETKNESFTNIFPPLEGMNTNMNSSPRRIQISDSKGMEILDRRYFWFKYIPDVFPEPAKIATSVIITILTAIITTLLVIFRFIK